jgi:hypothetical protein
MGSSEWTRNLVFAVGAVLAACYATPAFAVTTHFAVVRQDGLVTRSSETVVVERTGKGTYAVVFPSVLDVSECAFVATIGTGNGDQPAAASSLSWSTPCRRLSRNSKDTSSC